MKFLTRLYVSSLSAAIFVCLSLNAYYLFNTYTGQSLWSDDSDRYFSHNGDEPLANDLVSSGLRHQTTSHISLSPQDENAPPPRSAKEILHDNGFEAMSDYMEEALDWQPPRQPDLLHWPPYGDYRKASYDPNRWEGFERQNAYYFNSSLNESQSSVAEPYLPYPRYNSKAWKSRWNGKFKHCLGPRGQYLDRSPEDLVYAYKRPESSNFPQPSANGFEHLGLDPDVCFDRHSRYGAYGVGNDSSGGRELAPVDWEQVNWGELQDQCLARNEARFFPRARAIPKSRPPIDMPANFSREHDDEKSVRHRPEGRNHHPRTAVVIRSFSGYKYNENDILAIRAMITELSLFSGGEYTVVLLVQVKDSAFDIWESEANYQRALIETTPEELRSIAVLWTEEACKKAYPKVGQWDVYLHQWMPVQWFAATHPEFDFFWNWEMDIRNLGHHYEFFERIQNFARRQSRRLLWERNKRHWIPSVHGNYDQWRAETDAKIEAAVLAGSHPQPVWGPQPYSSDQTPLGARPPEDIRDDHWGIGEEADLITLLPIWDPRNTEWSFRNQIWNFVPGLHPDTEGRLLDMEFDNPEHMNIPRRAGISTVLRASRTLLRAMHLENQAGRTMQAEMWPTTVALHHGLKAVHAPHPIWFDRKWPALYADAVFNAHTEDSYDTHDLSASPPANLTTNPAGWTERADSPYNHDREWNFVSWSYYFRSYFAGTLYRRFLGVRTAECHDTGEAMETRHESPDLKLARLGETEDVYGGKEWEDEHGRMCLPSMLLHPVKNVVPLPEVNGQSSRFGLMSEGLRGVVTT